MLRRLDLDLPPGAEGLSAAAYAGIAAKAFAGFAAFNGAETIELERMESGNGRLERSLRAAVSKFA